MGAALTYARRYALFTLVGIAGEDDLDAPDLCDGPRSSRRQLTTARSGRRTSNLDAAANAWQWTVRGGASRANAPCTLDPEQSAALREKLLTELGNITSADRAAIWAQ